MKKIISNIILLNLAVLLLFGCKKDESTQVVAKATATPGALTASQSTLVLTKANATQSALSFTLTNPDYGFVAAVKNTLQIAKKGTNFAAPKEISLDAKVTSKAYTVIDFNAMMLTLGLPTGVASDIEARIVSKVADAIVPVYSNVVAIKVTPYALISFIYVPGDYQGWNPSTADSLISATSNGIYEGNIKYATGGTFEFKITPKKEWAVAYGDGGNSTLLNNGGGNLKVPKAGTYKITANLNSNTYSIVPNLWSIIGDATPGDWSADTDMSYNNGTRTWSLTVNLIGGKGMKFRLNHDWGLNYGDDGANLSIDANGANIAVATSGSYKVVLDLVNNIYSLTKL